MSFFIILSFHVAAAFSLALLSTLELTLKVLDGGTLTLFEYFRGYLRDCTSVGFTRLIFFHISEILLVLSMKVKDE